ncbi:MAG: twin-arginine translocase subunit TatC [Marmoricola sp.]
MSLSGVIDVFRGSPRQPVGEGGRMALGDHFRELRARLLRSVVYLVVGVVVALFFWHQLFDLILNPYNQARHMLGKSVTTKPVINGVGGPLLLQLKICGVAGVVASSPLWLAEIWGFIVPGLQPTERRWTRVFGAVAGPLFVVGVAVGYYVLPKGLKVLLGFTPQYVQSLVDFGEYFSFVTRMLLVFGVAFEIPLFVVLLNLAGVISGRQLTKHRPWIIVGTFIFAAVATPSTDPFSMLMLAIPMCVLFIVSEMIARVVDRRRRHARELAPTYADDESSSLDDDD